MKKIVDVNYLRRPELRDYLERSRENRIVFNDFAGIELHKGDAIQNLGRSLEIVSKYPTRVIVLKGTRDIVRLTLGPCKLPQCLYDIEQTIGFSDFCKQTRSAQEGDKYLTGQIVSKQYVASQYLEEQLQYHQFKLDGILGFAQSYDPSHLKSLRSGKEQSPAFLKRITKDIMLLAASLFREHPDVERLPEVEHLKNSFVFRYAVSAYFLSLRWIRDGGLDQVAPEKLLNDAIDMDYVAYATYFDGLLSLDKKLYQLYSDTIEYLRWIDLPKGQ